MVEGLCATRVGATMRHGMTASPRLPPVPCHSQETSHAMANPDRDDFPSVSKSRCTSPPAERLNRSAALDRRRRLSLFPDAMRITILGSAAGGGIPAVELQLP